MKKSKFYCSLALILMALTPPLAASSEPQNMSSSDLKGFCERFASIAYHFAERRNAGENVEDSATSMMAKILSDARNGEINKSVAVKMVSAIGVATLPEAGSARDTASYVYADCMEGGWYREN